LTQLHYSFEAPKHVHNALFSSIKRIFDYITTTNELRPGLILASNDARLLKQLARVVPPAYALTYWKSVHSIEPQQLLDLIQNHSDDDDSPVCPLGRYTLEHAALVFFSGFHEGGKILRAYEMSTLPFFHEWLEHTLLMTWRYSGVWVSNNDIKLQEDLIERYGPNVAALIADSCSILLLHQERSGSIPVLK
jgi:hypothetical protein